MQKTNVYELPPVSNVCNQILREIGKNLSVWSAAHVIMNPKAESLLHEHHKMEEIYIITRGTGKLFHGGIVDSVQAGDVVSISRNKLHGLVNTSAASLEHLVLVSPPFDSADVYLSEKKWKDHDFIPLVFEQPPVTDCFDGAKIISYEMQGIASIAFGWVTSDPTRRKQAHYHEKSTEWIYVVEGSGIIKTTGIHDIAAGDWIRIDPGEKHSLRNDNDQNMVVVCICTPCFDVNDVHYY